MLAPVKPTLLLTTEDAALIQHIFDDMAALMGATYTSCNASVASSVGAITSSITVADALGNSYTINNRIAGPKVTVMPFGASLGPGETQQFTATVTDSTGAAVPAPTLQWAITFGGYGTVDQTGLYTAPATIASQIYDILTVTEQPSGSSVAVTVNLHPTMTI